MALHAIQQSGRFDVKSLLTTIVDDDERIPIHGVHRDLMQRQAAALNLPIQMVKLPRSATNSAYEAALIDALSSYLAEGTDAIAYGDLFLADIRAYREQLAAKTKMSALFPLWGINTRDLARSFISAGFRAIVVSVDVAVLDGSFAGRMFDAEFLAALPGHVDPCGERGEFHTFVFDGPNFMTAVDVREGDVLEWSAA